MADTENKPKLEVVQTPLDALDLTGLWLDPALGDGITETVRHSIPLGKPRDFFRVHPDKSFRRPIEIYRHRPEGVIEDEFFALWGDMKETLEEAAPYSLVTCIYRDGTPAHLAGADGEGRRARQRSVDFGTRRGPRGDRQLGEAGMGRRGLHHGASQSPATHPIQIGTSCPRSRNCWSKPSGPKASSATRLTRFIAT